MFTGVYTYKSSYLKTMQPKKKSNLTGTLSAWLILAIPFLFYGSVSAQQNAVVVPGNPVIKSKYTADPAAFVEGDSVYLYTGHDEGVAGRDGYVMHEWLCF